MEEIDLEVDFLFDQATLSLVRSVGVFSERWYVSTYPEVSQSQNTLLEFMRSGWLAGRKPNEHFDPLWYLSTNDDVKQARKHPLVHYLLYGEREGRKPVPYFDPSWYRVNYRVAPEESCLSHFLKNPGNYSMPKPRYLQFTEAVIKTIAVTRLDGLGDLMLGSSLLEGLHRKFPRAVINLIVRPHHASVRELLPSWIRVTQLPFDQYAVPQSPANMGDLAPVIFDFALGFQPDLVILGEFDKVWVSEVLASLWTEATVVSFSSSSALGHQHGQLMQKIGNATLDDTRHRKVEALADEHELRKYEHMLAALGCPQGTRPMISVSEPALGHGVDVYNQLGINPARTVVLFPSSADGLVKSLTAKTWAEIAMTISNATDFDVVVVGSPKDSSAIDSITSLLRDPFPVHIVGGDELPKLAAFISLAHAYVGSDTGPLHLAAALGKKAIGFYGGGHRAHRFLPVGNVAYAFRMPLECYGCNWECPFESRLCLSGIEIDVIREPLLTILSDCSRPLPSGSVAPCHIVELPTTASIGGALVSGLQRINGKLLATNHTNLGYIDNLDRKSEQTDSHLEELRNGLQANILSVDRLARQLNSIERAFPLTTIKSNLSQASPSRVFAELHSFVCKHHTTRSQCLLKGHEVSVLVTSFRRYDKLERAIASLYENHISSIVVSAAGVDPEGCLELMRLVRRFPSVRITATETDLGCNKTWLNGLYQIATKFVIILHDDDLLAPEFAGAFTDYIGPALATEPCLVLWDGRIFDYERLILTNEEVCNFTYNERLPPATGFYDPAHMLALYRDRHKSVYPLSPSVQIFRTSIARDVLKECEQMFKTPAYRTRKTMMIGNDIMMTLRSLVMGIDTKKPFYYVNLALTHYGRWTGSESEIYVRSQSSQLTDCYAATREYFNRFENNLCPLDPTILHAVSLFDQTGDDRRRGDLAMLSWSILANKGEEVLLPLYDNDFARSSRDVGDRKSMPFIRDLIDQAAAHCEQSDIIVITNSDICLIAESLIFVRARLARQTCTFAFRRDQASELSSLMGLVDTHSLEGYVGADLFAFTKGWWLQWGPTFPDLIIGKPNWDWVLRFLMAYSVQGPEMLRGDQNEIGRAIEMPGIIYHEKHPSYAEREDVYVRDLANLHCWVHAFLFFRRYYTMRDFDTIEGLQIFHEAHLPEICAMLYELKGDEQLAPLELLTAAYFVQNLDYNEWSGSRYAFNARDYVGLNWDVRHMTDTASAEAHWLEFGMKNRKLPKRQLLKETCISSTEHYENFPPLNRLYQLCRGRNIKYRELLGLSGFLREGGLLADIESFLCTEQKSNATLDRFLSDWSKRNAPGSGPQPNHRKRKKASQSLRHKDRGVLGERGFKKKATATTRLYDGDEHGPT